MEHSPLSPHNTEAWMTPPPPAAASPAPPAPVEEQHPPSTLIEHEEKRQLRCLQPEHDKDTALFVPERRSDAYACSWGPRFAPQAARFWFALGMIAVVLSIQFAARGGGDLLGRHGYFRASSGDGGSEHSGSVAKQNGTNIDWDDITPSEKLKWHRCPTSIDPAYFCTRLTVPMDYHRPLKSSLESPIAASKDHPKVHIAMVMVPSSEDRDLDDPASFSESPMLINPGGPGGSGASFAAGPFGGVIRGLIGGKHDVIGFDPRGVGATTPGADCFEVHTDNGGAVTRRNQGLLNRIAWDLSGHEIGIINSTNAALGKHNVRAKAVGRLCGKAAEYDGDDSIFKYANTPNVARDMLSIIHAWDEWRSGSQTDDEIAQNENHASHDGGDNQDPSSTKGKLVYWGFSYGTLLGATFASMFPDKVGRVMLDGVVDADHYVAPAWTDSLRDADQIYESFYTYCLRAGVSCALFRRGDTSAKDIRNRMDSFLAELAEEPRVAIPTGDDGGMPILISSGDVKQILFVALYSPNAMFPLIAQMLDSLMQERELFFPGTGIGLPAFCHAEDIPIAVNDAQKAVMCSDKRYKLNETVPELQKRFEEMSSYSKFSDVWLGIMMGCNHWPIDAKDPPMRWDDHPAHKPKPIVTSFPLLFLSNMLDPVTPLHAALKMTRRFANASIVEQWAEGHCTISCVSSCTVAHIRAYLLDGVLPPPPKFKTPDSGDWAKCICEATPWGNPLAGSGSGDGEARLLQAVLGLPDLESSHEFAAAYRDAHLDVVRNAQLAQISDHNPLKDYLIKALE
ncbi:TAP-like protein-domain-containing protein [Microdochium trichocladiopsis]|uniref:TAP-like protein-domain-containing protein n=1 Tax=Microdochium trichocladiopsis TaxID=1682393 RepID=A0A9P9BRS3_9PEZI|nr:TAP-like protein-domain-containing protein [Microdochium trichocladiopsis]KAH7033236.1 TAP-like protein-domain-containing protein [Microdochium trichocladiopsis]